MVSFIWQRRILVAVHNELAPSEPEWCQYLALVEELSEIDADYSTVCGLSVTEGGAPGHMQRALLNRLLRARVVRSAVVTDSTLVRGVIAALGLFNPLIKGFPAQLLSESLAYLGLSAEEQPTLLQALAEARSQLVGGASVGVGGLPRGVTG